MRRVHRLTLFANLLAIAIVATIIEAMIPVIPVPGAKLGLANVMTLLVMVILGAKEALGFTILRVFLAYLLSGRLGPTFYMSLSGAMLSALFMVGLYKTNYFGLVGVSLIGSIIHCIGQVIAGYFVIGSSAILYYLPLMLVLSIPTGILVGILAQLLLDKVKLLKVY